MRRPDARSRHSIIFLLQLFFRAVHFLDGNIPLCDRLRYPRPLIYLVISWNLFMFVPIFLQTHIYILCWNPLSLSTELRNYFTRCFSPSLYNLSS